MTIKELPDVVTVQEVAKFLKIGKNAAYELVNSGQLKSVRVGRQIRISKVALIEFLGITETV